MGDYAKDQVAEAMDKPTITGDAVEHYLRLAPGKRAVAFCASVAHAEHVADAFRASGIPASFLDGSLDPAERDKRIKDFEAGRTLVLTSCDVVSEGFDLPAIEVAILLRPTKSLSLYLQQVGRALRVFEGKEYAIILDHVGAISSHGLPDEDREWSLEGITKKKRAANDNMPDVNITTCPMCFTIHMSAPECPTCGHKYAVVPRTGPKQQDGELVELTAAAKEQLRRRAEIEKQKARKQRLNAEHQCQSLDDLIQLGKDRGYQYPRQWAERRWAFIENGKKRTG
jgi:superfamily II DNA or RNA helicase